MCTKFHSHRLLLWFFFYTEKYPSSKFVTKKNAPNCKISGSLTDLWCKRHCIIGSTRPPTVSCRRRNESSTFQGLVLLLYSGRKVECNLWFGWNELLSLTKLDHSKGPITGTLCPAFLPEDGRRTSSRKGLCQCNIYVTGIVHGKVLAVLHVCHKHSAMKHKTQTSVVPTDCYSQSPVTAVYISM
jgi:hypothetical protein